MTIRDTDNGYKALLARMEVLKTPATVRVGIHSDDGAAKEGQTPLIDIATIHEFGTSTIPARSFLRAWMDENGAAAQALYTAQIKSFLKGSVGMPTALSRVGSFIVGGIKLRIANGIAPPLAPVTILRKGSSTPLIDTGQLRGAITYSYTWAGGSDKAPAKGNVAARKGSKA